MTAAVILAAGASRRLGEPKQMVRLGGRTLLERAVGTATAAGCSPVIVVLGAAHVEVLGHCALGGATHVVNPEWAEGMASSIRTGVRAAAAAGADGAIVMACDQPAVTAEHLRALVASGRVTASAYAGRAGVPAYFPAEAFAGLLALTGDTGARELLVDAEAVELVHGEIDVDTAVDLDEAERLFGSLLSPIAVRLR